MKKLIRKILPVFIVFLVGLGFFPTRAFATSPASTFAADAAILTGCAGAEKGGGEGIKCVILTVVNILSVLVGIVGIIGIVIVGLQYLTAGGNEEQTRKAKRRLFEIIIGIVAYALVAALLSWLLPNYRPDTNSTSLNDSSTTASSIITSGD